MNNRLVISPENGVWRWEWRCLDTDTLLCSGSACNLSDAMQKASASIGKV